MLFILLITYHENSGGSVIFRGKPSTACLNAVKNLCHYLMSGQLFLLVSHCLLVFLVCLYNACH